MAEALMVEALSMAAGIQVSRAAEALKAVDILTAALAAWAVFLPLA
jgi:hypothetical protein